MCFQYISHGPVLCLYCPRWERIQNTCKQWFLKQEFIMENNPYRYDKNISRQVPQNRSVQQHIPGRKVQPPRMPKEKALALTRLFKKSLVVVSLASFASISGAIALHQVTTSVSTTSTTSTTTTATATATTQHTNTFLNQQGDDNLGNSTPTPTATTSGSSSSTSGSTSGPGTTSSSPSSGSHVS